MTNFDLAEALETLPSPTSIDWSTFGHAIPKDVIIFTTNDGRFKVGNGMDVYASLPSGPTLSGIAAGQQNLVNVLTALVALNESAVIIIDNEMYDVGSSTLTSIISRIDAVIARDVAQDSELDVATSQNSLVNSNISSLDNDKIAVVNSHQMSPGMIADDLILEETYKLHLIGAKAYEDEDLTIEADTIEDNAIYYIQIASSHDVEDYDLLSFTLSSNSSAADITNLGRGKFKITIGDIAINTQIVLTATCAYGADSEVYDLQITAVNSAVSLHISSIATYSDRACTVPKTMFDENTTGYCKVTYFHDSVPNSLLDLSLRAIGDTPIVDLGNGIFKFYINDLAYTRTIFTATLAYDYKAVESSCEIECSGQSSVLLSIYGGLKSDILMKVAVDSDDNIICAGYTYSEGIGSPTYYSALIVKFDSNMNILAKKTYSGAFDDILEGIAVDSNDNIIITGRTKSEGISTVVTWCALIVKFDSNLNILARKLYEGNTTGSDYFYTVKVDSNNNIITVGYSGSDSSAALVVKFDNNLNILARKIYSGAGSEIFRSIAIDSSNNIICAGYTFSEGTGSPTYYSALVVKFDSNLNILARKIYSGASYDIFYSVAIDASNNVICVGDTLSEGVGSPTYANAFIVKFDSNLNILQRKVFGRNYLDRFSDVAIDSNNNIICVGFSNIVSAGSPDAMIVKFDSSLNIVHNKFLHGTNSGALLGVAIDSNDNIVCAGYTYSYSPSTQSHSLLVARLANTIPSGTFTGTTIDFLTLSDATGMTIAYSNLTLADSAITLAYSNLPLSDSNLSLADINFQLFMRDAVA